VSRHVIGLFWHDVAAIPARGLHHVILIHMHANRENQRGATRAHARARSREMQDSEMQIRICVYLCKSMYNLFTTSSGELNM